MKKKNLMKTVLITASAIGLTWALNKAIFYYSTMKKILSSEDGHLYKWRFGNIYYKKSGEGKPLLLVHDLSCDSSGYEWRYIVEALSKKHTVYVIDLLGCGHSDKPKITYTNYMYVQLLNDFIKEIIKGKTNVIASGRSAELAMMACHMEPNLFNRLLFVNPIAPQETALTPNLKGKLVKHIVSMPIVGTLIYNLCFTKGKITKRFYEVYIDKKEHIRQADIEAYHEAAHLGGSSSKFLYASLLSHFTEVCIDRAVKLSDHSIFIIGSEDEEDAMDAYTILNPAIETVVEEDCGKLIHVEAPEKMLEHCRIFL